jgi:porphobilinogen deaminase
VTLWGSALTVATLAANATIGTSAKRRKTQPTEMKDFRFIIKLSSN